MDRQGQKTILLVEDDAISTLATVARLKKFGYAVVTTNTGEKSIQIAAGAGKIDLILMDIGLGGGIDGLEAARQILVLRTIPIIFLTGHSEQETIENARGIPCYGYVIKEPDDFVLQSSIEMAFDLFDAHVKVRESEGRFRALVEWTPEAAVVHRDGKILYVNPAAVALFGAVSAQDLVGRPILDRIHPDFHQIALTRQKNMLDNGVDASLAEMKYIQLDGTIAHAEIRATQLVYDGAPAIHVSLRDITEGKRAEEKLRQLSQAVEQSPVSIMITDTAGSIEYVNPKFIEVTGYFLDEVVGKNPRFLKSGYCSPEEYSELWKTLTTGGEWHGEFHNKKKNGDLYWESATISPIVNGAGETTHFLAVKEDITEHKQAEEKLKLAEKRLLRSEKMEAIGLLAGGIAHDFNNILTGIIGYTGMSERHADNNPVLKNNLQIVLAASDRAKNLVQQILSFSHQSVHQKEIIELTPIVMEVIDLLKAAIPSSVEIKADLQPGVKPVFADSTKLHEVILNLATNAVHAMNQNGVLTIRLYPKIFHGVEYVQTGELTPGEYSVIEITDTGSGMDSFTLSKVFEPFFTTKAFGVGTGMGLSVVHGIIQQHGGNIHIESIKGKGSTFKIYLRAFEGFDSGAGVKNPEKQYFGTERVLFVDDEPMLVTMAESEFPHLGYTVTCMSNGRDALEFMKKNPHAIDILITDQTMPGMTGIELAKEALLLQKNLLVILCTGFSTMVNPELITSVGIHESITKPYEIKNISRLIRAMVDKIKDRQ
jgi:PAS domain S-box-containing protein